MRASRTTTSGRHQRDPAAGGLASRQRLWPGRVLLAGLVAGAYLVGGAAGTTQACLCRPVVPLSEQELASADPSLVVFTGVATTKDEATLFAPAEPSSGEPVHSSPDTIIWTFAVDGILAGDVADPQMVQTPRDGGLCGFRFEAGQRYLVDGRRQADGLWTSSCSRTVPLPDRRDR